MKPLINALRGLVEFIENDPERFSSPHLNCRDCNEFTPIRKPELCPLHTARRALDAAAIPPAFSAAEVARRCAARFFKDRSHGKATVEAHLSKPELEGLLASVVTLAFELRDEGAEKAAQVLGALPSEAESPGKASLPKAGEFPKSLFAPEERMRLKDRGYSDEDIAKIRRLTVAMVEGQAEKGEVNPDDPDDLKRAIKIAGQQALTAYNSALEYLAG